MHCKHLLYYSHNTNIWSVASCSAKNTPYVPSLHELERFCQNGRHTVCPSYLYSGSQVILINGQEGAVVEECRWQEETEQFLPRLVAA